MHTHLYPIAGGCSLPGGRRGPLLSEGGGRARIAHCRAMSIHGRAVWDNIPNPPRRSPFFWGDAVGQEDTAHRYGLAKPRWHVVEGGQVPTGYQLTVAGGCEVYTNGCDPQGTTWYTNGSRKGNPAGMGGATGTCRAGFGLHRAPLHVIGRVRGPQTPYRAALMGMYVASCLARAGDEVVLDNQAAADCATAARYHEVCDMDVREPLAQELHSKSLMPRWVPGHREERQARTPQKVQDTRGNNLSHSLASMGSELPLTPYTPDAPHGIGVGGTEAPVPAKKWITAMCPHATPEGVHWATWLPLKAKRRRLWL